VTLGQPVPVGARWPVFIMVQLATRYDRLLLLRRCCTVRGVEGTDWLRSGRVSALVRCPYWLWTVAVTSVARTTPCHAAARFGTGL